MIYECGSSCAARPGNARSPPCTAGWPSPRTSAAPPATASAHLRGGHQITTLVHTKMDAIMKAEAKSKDGFRHACDRDGKDSVDLGQQEQPARPRPPQARARGLGLPWCRVHRRPGPVRGRARHFSAPRHKHNFDQIRYIVSGRPDFGHYQVASDGQSGFFPAGAAYGPETIEAAEMLLIQWGEHWMTRAQHDESYARMQQPVSSRTATTSRSTPPGTSSVPTAATRSGRPSTGASSSTRPRGTRSR